jgi:hypothetical protein
VSQPPHHDRRAGERYPAAACDWLAAVRLRFGDDMTVINVSRGGLLVETGARLLPNAGIDLQATIQGDTRVVQGRVLRSQVCAILESGIRYRAAVAFGPRLDPSWNAAMEGH